MTASVEMGKKAEPFTLELTPPLNKRELMLGSIVARKLQSAGFGRFGVGSTTREGVLMYEFPEGEDMMRQIGGAMGGVKLFKELYSDVLELDRKLRKKRMRRSRRNLAITEAVDLTVGTLRVVQLRQQIEATIAKP